MKKIIVSLAVLLVFAVPASAAVEIICTADGNQVTVSFTNTDQESGNPVRAFALDITIDDPCVKIISVDPNMTGESIDPNLGYGIFPASFSRVIDPEAPIWDDPAYTPVALPEDLPDDTQPGMDSNGITVELGSIYVGGPNRPTEGPLLTFEVNDVNTSCNVVLALNVSRGGVVMEDGSTPTPTLTGCALGEGLCPGDVTGTVTGRTVSDPPPPFIIGFDISLWEGPDGTFDLTDLQALQYLLEDTGGPVTSADPNYAIAAAADVTYEVTGRTVSDPPPPFIIGFDITLWQGPDGSFDLTDLQALQYLLEDEGGPYTCP